MRRRPTLLWLGLAFGCTVAPPGPTAALPPDEPRHFVDADAAEQPDDAAPVEDDAPVEPTTTTVAPEIVDLEINDRYVAETDPTAWANRFEREGREVFDHRDRILAELSLRPGLDVADVGAGTGMLTLDLARSVADDGTVYAVDVQAYMLDHIGQKAKKAGLSNVKLVRASQDSAGLEPGSIDLAIMVDAYHHVERPAPYLASLHSALREGGRLVIVDYRRDERSSPFIREHIRASAEQFRDEIQSAGFRFLASHDGILEENFFFEFEKI